MEIRSASWLEFFVFSGRSLIAAIIYIREVTCNHFSSKLRVKAVSHTWSKHKQKILSAPAKMISHTYTILLYSLQIVPPTRFQKVIRFRWKISIWFISVLEITINRWLSSNPCVGHRLKLKKSQKPSSKWLG